MNITPKGLRPLCTVESNEFLSRCEDEMPPDLNELPGPESKEDDYAGDWHTYDPPEPEPPAAPKIAAPIGGGCIFRDGYMQDASYVLQRRVPGKKEAGPAFTMQEIAGPFQILAGLKSADGQRRTRLRWRDAGRAVQTADISLDGLLNPRSQELQALFRRDFPVRPGREVNFCDALRRLEFSRIIRSLDAPGWQDLDGAAFYVTAAGKAIGASERIDLASPSAQPGEFTAIGTHEGWNEVQGALSRGNYRSMFFICAALAAPLLKLVGEPGGMIHVFGQTGDGKSSLLKLAGSVWGRGSAHMRGWASTGNGLEALFANTHDSMVLLDEMRPSRGDADRISDVVFQLSNGLSTGRMTKDRRQDEMKSWTILGLSTGEMGLVEASRKSKNPLKGGAEARCLGFPSDAGAGHGVYDRLNGAVSDNALSRMLSDACEHHAGHVGPAFLAAVVAELQSAANGFKRRFDDFRDAFLAREIGGNRDLIRACSRFAVIAFAGEMATETGALPWDAGEAQEAASVCLRAFIAARGTTGSLDDLAAVTALESYLTAHPGQFPELDTYGVGFVPVNGTHSGWRRKTADGLEYAVFATAWSEILADHKPSITGRMLQRLGLHRSDRRPISGKTARYHIVPDDLGARYTEKTTRDEA